MKGNGNVESISSFIFGEVHLFYLKSFFLFTARFFFSGNQRLLDSVLMHTSTRDEFVQMNAHHTPVLALRFYEDKQGHVHMHIHTHMLIHTQNK